MELFFHQESYAVMRPILAPGSFGTMSTQLVGGNSLDLATSLSISKVPLLIRAQFQPLTRRKTLSISASSSLNRSKTVLKTLSIPT